MMENDGTYSKVFGKKAKKPPVDPAKIRNIVLLAVAAILVLSVAASCWYTVDDKQQAVVTTFGKVTDTVDAGLHFKIPLGIQKVYPVNVNVYQKIELGYTTQADGSTVSNTS